MRFLHRAAALLVTFSVPVTAQAQKSCMTEPEATALFAFALPELIDTVADKCSPTLPAQAYLRSSAPTLVQRYRSEAAPNWPQAKAAFMKTMGEEDKDAAKLFSALPDEAMKALIATALASVVADDIKPENCDNIDRIAGSLAPLSLTQLSTLFTGIIVMADGKKDSSLKICPAR